MKAVVGLLVMLMGTSHAVETSCDGRQDEARCFGALGGTVFIQLMNNASEIYKFQWKKNNQILLNVQNDKISYTSENRYQFSCNNGTFRINRLSRNDSGGYKLEMFDSAGKSTGTKTLQLSVQAPVSSVQLVPQCLSQGQMKVFCSSEGGDSPQYSWTLDGHTLTDSELLCGNNASNIIILRQHVSGRLVCSVRNHVSNLSKEQIISVCAVRNHVSNLSKEQIISVRADRRLLVCSLLFVVAIFSYGGIILYFKWKETKYKRESSASRRKEPLEEVQ